MLITLKPVIIIIILTGLAAARPQKTNRPATKRGTIGLEGAQKRFTFKLFDSSKNSLSVPFTTYVPDDMVPQTERADAGDRVTFFANFDGERNPYAYLQINILPEGVSEDTARVGVGAIAIALEQQKRRSDAPNRFKWSLVEHDFMDQTPSGEWFMGTVALGRHNDRYFYVIIQYPENYEEGLVPRAYRILDEWRWRGGQRL